MVVARFTVHGSPVPQGSKKVVPTPHGARAIDVNRGPLMAWRQSVTDAAVAWRATHGNGDMPWTGPVWVRATFLLPPPKSLPKRDVGQWQRKRPDIDKLTRALLDALTTARLFGDDAQVALLEVSKRYALPEEPLSCTVEASVLDPLAIEPERPGPDLLGDQMELF